MIFLLSYFPYYRWDAEGTVPACPETVSGPLCRRRKQFPRILRPDDLSEYLSGCGRVSAVSVSVRNLRQDISLEALPHVGPCIPVPQVRHNFMIEGLAPINDVVGPGIIPRLQMSAE